MLVLLFKLLANRQEIYAISLEKVINLWDLVLRLKII